MTGQKLGTFCMVLHSHLPWLAGHGTWPVGEEWLYQAWAHSYLPLVRMLERFAAEGREDVLTLGVTPVLAAQLDDPYSLRGAHDWLGNWSVRAQYAANRWRSADPLLREVAAAEYRDAEHALEDFETRWRHGFSPLLRRLVDARAVELLGGPVTHPFQPLLDPRLREFALRSGLADTTLRLGSTPEGIWAPECGYSPGMEAGYAAAGVRRFLVDGPALHGDTAAARPVGDSDVLCFGRDLEVAYRVWSPKSGYPGDPAYRDFHTFDHPSGLKPSRVTGKTVPPGEKKPYEPQRAARAVDKHVADFVDLVRSRLTELRERHGKPSLVVAAYDTELYGHWWHEGPAWLEGVLRALPEAGIEVTTLRGAAESGHVGAPVELPASSWGSGKDWRVWEGGKVADIVEANEKLQHVLLSAVDDQSGEFRDPRLDRLASEAMLALASDWAFMVSKDSAVDYAQRRAAVHTERCYALAAGADPHTDTVFGHLDARELARTGG
ncbi:1,4-alpha-glucan branching protein domain-containing protein [Sciscionella sediminilitoris]|uniref:1,4-alpha-glucan branching protein domain-containing protein n=1 Tax=Sciscionella sediminilitoris TaxID=1445613 RepID=UPI0004DF1FB0|nr:glycoside hydrolase family 57 protein [Sciscionella sp. SE31]